MERKQLSKLLSYSVFLIFATGMFLAPLPLGTCQVSKPSEEKITRLVSARAGLQKNPEDPALQQKYLDAFPTKYSDFLLLFDDGRPLSDGYEYISVLPLLAKNNELEVGRLLVQLSKDAQWEADAPNFLQDATATYGSEHPIVFAKMLTQLPPADRSNLITFLADKETTYPHYEKIIKELQAQHQVDLAAEFEAAREKRKKRLHD